MKENNGRTFPSNFTQFITSQLGEFKFSCMNLEFCNWFIKCSLIVLDFIVVLLKNEIGEAPHSIQFSMPYQQIGRAHV